MHAAAAGIEFGAGGGFGFFGDLNFVDDGAGASCFCHSRGRAFVLDDVGFSFNGGDTAGRREFEVVPGDFGFGQFGLDAGLDFGVGEFGGWDGDAFVGRGNGGRASVWLSGDGDCEEE